MAYLVAAGTAQVVGRGYGAGAAKVHGRNHYAVGGRRAARKLGVAQNAAADGAHPQVQVLAGVPGVEAAGAGFFDFVGRAPGGDGAALALDAGGGYAGGRALGQHELNACIGHQPGKGAGGFGVVRVQLVEVLIQHGNLRGNLGIRDVLRSGAVQHVHYYRNGHGYGRRAALSGTGLLGCKHHRLVVDVGHAGGQARVGGELLL